MGRQRTSSRSRSKNKSYKKQHDTKRRRRDIDQVHDDLEKEEREGAPMAFEASDDLPGDEATLEKHRASKPHKRRLKDLSQEKYTQDEADRAAGKTKEVLPPAHSTA